eukprot:TRINITY_DN12095_c4_g5_i1.p1 TRINITY_DN12095_c4_g5~~TRINITY_DN12095_c4_g5_i1.p1  ORF type:complete len:376 (+),score=78.24 TRINITY_DN12095_c4_g5_i1:59-1186(+)
MLSKRNSSANDRLINRMDSNFKELAFKASTLEHEKSVMESLLQDADEQLQNQTETISMLEARCRQQATELAKERERLMHLEQDCTSLEDELVREKAVRNSAKYQLRRRSSAATANGHESPRVKPRSPLRLDQQLSTRSDSHTSIDSIASIDSVLSESETPVPDENSALDQSLVDELLPQLQLLETSLAEKQALERQVAQLQEQLEYREQQLQEARESETATAFESVVHILDDLRALSPSLVSLDLTPHQEGESLASEFEQMAMDNTTEASPDPSTSGEEDDDEFHDACDELDVACQPSPLELKLASITEQSLTNLLQQGPQAKACIEQAIINPLQLEKSEKKQALTKLRSVLCSLEAEDKLLMAIRDDTLVFMLR